MIIRIICVGKLKERALKELCQEYQKRLSHYCTLQLVEVPDESAPESLSDAQLISVLQKEGQGIRASIKDGLVCCLDLSGKQMDSLQFASWVSELEHGGNANINLIIGGSNGLDPALVQSADTTISLSKLTFPHNIARLLLLEQLYRAMRINRNEPYHK